MKGTGYAYGGRCPKCGALCCVVAEAAPDDPPLFKKNVARRVSEWMVQGLTIERVTNDFVRQNYAACKCNKDDGPSQQLPMFDESANQYKAGL